MQKNCSKCECPATHSVVIRVPPQMEKREGKLKNVSAVRVVPLCEEHWKEVDEFLPTPEA